MIELLVGLANRVLQEGTELLIRHSFSRVSQCLTQSFVFQRDVGSAVDVAVDGGTMNRRMDQVVAGFGWNGGGGRRRVRGQGVGETASDHGSHFLEDQMD